MSTIITESVLDDYTDDILGNIQREQENLAQANEQKYRDMLIAIAEGNSIPPKHVTAILQATNRTHEKFRKHLSKLIEGKQHVANLGAEAAIAPRVAELQAECQAAGDLILEERKRHRETIDPLSRRQSIAATELRRLQDDATQKVREAKAFFSKHQSEATRKQFDQLSDRSCRLASQLQQAERGLPSIQREREAVESGIKDLEKRLANLASQSFARTKQQDLEREIQAGKDRLALLDRQVAELEQLRIESPAAREALEKFTAEVLPNWRSIDFD